MSGSLARSDLRAPYRHTVPETSTTGPEAADQEEFSTGGIEKPLAVSFSTMRDFTQLAQSQLPYDIVFLLNEFFAAAGNAITLHEGWIDKFLGDGLLAVFGDKRDSRSAAAMRSEPREPLTWRSTTSMQRWRQN